MVRTKQSVIKNIEDFIVNKMTALLFKTAEKHLRYGRMY